MGIEGKSEKSNHFHLCYNILLTLSTDNEQKREENSYDTHTKRAQVKKGKCALGLRTNTGTSVYGRP